MPQFDVGDTVIVDYSLLTPPQPKLLKYWKDKAVTITKIFDSGVIEVNYPSSNDGSNARHWPQYLKKIDRQLLLFEL